MANTMFHPTTTRGNTNIGWLNGFHSFSFGPYYNASRLAFGVLKVLNDDTVQPGKGFGTHSHANMEIISIPLSGTISHQDSTGKEALIKTGDVQVMSAGKGIAHSEYNPDANNDLKFLQIWIAPNQQNVQPRYQQLTLGEHTKNQFQQIVSPNPNDEGLWIYQNAWLHLGKFEKGKAANYTLKQPGNGLYIFLLEGKIQVEGKTLKRRDALEIGELHRVSIAVEDAADILLIEVPIK